MVSVDFFVVPTIRFQILYVLLVLAHHRRRIVHFAVTAHPTAEWTAQQMREAFPLGHRSALSVTRSGSDLRQGLRRLGEGNGNQTSAFRTPVALAACVRGTGDRHHSPRVPGSHDRIRRTLLVPTPSKLHQLLSSKSDAFGIREGQPGAPADPAASVGTDHRNSGYGRVASSLRAARRLNSPPTFF